MKHIVVIPTYNEAENIESLINEIFQNYDNLSILIVDDSSPDGTAAIIKNLQSKYNKLHLIIQEKKEGLAIAYINGFKWCLNNGFDVFSTCDADFSHNPKYFKQVIEYINSGYDVICGSRYNQGGNTSEKNFFRNFISIGGNIFSRLILGYEMHDWTGGFNTYNKSAIEKIDLNSIKAKGYIFQAEIKYKLIHSGAKYIEFPIDFIPRTKGKSKMDIYIILEAFISAFRIKMGF